MKMDIYNTNSDYRNQGSPDEGIQKSEQVEMEMTQLIDRDSSTNKKNIMHIYKDPGKKLNSSSISQNKDKNTDSFEMPKIKKKNYSN